MTFYADDKTTSTKELFYRKNSYNVTVLEELKGGLAESGLETKIIKDFLMDEKLLYGRVTAAGEPVILDKEILRPVGSTAASVMVQNFVADAFNDMALRANAALATNRAKASQSVFFPLVPKKGYVDPTVAYSRYIDFLSGDFSENFMRDQRKKEKIVNFETFLPFFREFLEFNAPNTPFTRTEYLISSFVSPLSSGLMIEIHDGDYGNDAEKGRLFYRNDDFALFQKIASFHGFIIDKHIPWRLVADIGSPNMLPYLMRYHLSPTPSSVMYFGREKTHFSDIFMLKNMAVSFYNRFASRFPVTQASRCTNKINIIRRQPTNFRSANESTEDFFWFKLYAEVRNWETGINYDDGAMDDIFENIFDMAGKFDRRRVSGYISSMFRGVEHYAGSLFHDVTRFELSGQPKVSGQEVDEMVKRSVREHNIKTAF